MSSLEPFRPASRTALLEWAADSVDTIWTMLRSDGVVWLRGFTATRHDLAQQLLTTLGVDLMDDVFFSTPRSSVSDKTFTATEYPSNQQIPLHSEMAYLTRFPRLLCFHTLACPEQGGETTIGDLDAISADLGALTTAFLDRGVRYIRIFHTGLDIPLTTAFGTEDLDEIATIASAHGMAFDAGGEGRPPRLTYTAQGALRDSVTGTAVWFNQAAVHHPARLPTQTRAVLIKMYGPEGLPRQATFGDGASIPDETINEINAALTRHIQLIRWAPGDVVLLDNLRFAHGRQPFVGKRTVHVSMGMPCRDALRTPLLSPMTAAEGGES